MLQYYCEQQGKSDDMEEVKKRLIKFREERDWKQFHTPENLAKSIAIEAGELLEVFQWNNDYDIERVKEELADVMSYCVLLAEDLNLDIPSIMQDKIDKNEQKYPVHLAKGSSKKYTELKKEKVEE